MPPVLYGRRAHQLDAIPSAARSVARAQTVMSLCSQVVMPRGPADWQSAGLSGSVTAGWAPGGGKHLQHAPAQLAWLRRAGADGVSVDPTPTCDPLPTDLGVIGDRQSGHDFTVSLTVEKVFAIVAISCIPFLRGPQVVARCLRNARITVWRDGQTDGDFAAQEVCWPPTARLAIGRGGRRAGSFASCCTECFACASQGRSACVRTAH